jgi:GNAT superfamily N-acetyltransferase
MRAGKWRCYLYDWRTFLGDARLAYRSEGLSGVWSAFAERSLFRVLRTGRMVVFAQPLDTVPDIKLPAGVTIAPIGEGDWPAVATLVGQRELQRFRSLLTRGRHCLVAWRGSRPVGYGWVAGQVGPDVTVWPLPLSFPAHAAYLYNLYVVPSERGSGIGSALASARLHTARSLGFREGWRMVAPTNEASLRTMERSANTTRTVGEVRYIKLLSRTYARFTPAPVRH